jgi:hypothetical protein
MRWRTRMSMFGERDRFARTLGAVKTTVPPGDDVRPSPDA